MGDHATLKIRFPESKLAEWDDQESVRLNPGTWSKYATIRPLGDLPSTISRSELLDQARQTDLANDAELKRLFTLTMMWGSGTSNGRGPRNTRAALSRKSSLAALRHSHELLVDGDISAAYLLHRRIDQVGPSFHTKWLWVIGRAADVQPVPLIQDQLVWRALGELGWNSKEASGTNRWGQRYLAYLDACEAWASATNATPEDIEYSLFRWGKQLG